MTSSARARRVDAHFSSIASSSLPGTLDRRCAASTGPRLMASRRPRDIPWPPIGACICPASPIRRTAPPLPTPFSSPPRRKKFLSAIAAWILNREDQTMSVMCMGVRSTKAPEERKSRAYFRGRGTPGVWNAASHAVNKGSSRVFRGRWEGNEDDDVFGRAYSEDIGLWEGQFRGGRKGYICDDHLGKRLLLVVIVAQSIGVRESHPDTLANLFYLCNYGML